jgi:hypothetical protein
MVPGEQQAGLLPSRKLYIVPTRERERERERGGEVGVTFVLDISLRLIAFASLIY